MHTMHTSRSQSRSGSHLSHEENTRSMQLEIDHLRRRLRHERHRGIPSTSNPSSDDDRDNSYRPRLFSCDKDHHYRRRRKSSSCKDLGNNAISRALNQISNSPFTHWIEGGKLPR